MNLSHLSSSDRLVDQSLNHNNNSENRNFISTRQHYFMPMAIVMIIATIAAIISLQSAIHASLSPNYCNSIAVPYGIAKTTIDVERSEAWIATLLVLKDKDRNNNSPMQARSCGEICLLSMTIVHLDSSTSISLLHTS